MRRIFSSWLRSLNLRTKLFITIIISALVPLFAVIITLYAYLSGSLSDQSEYAARTTLRQTRDYLAYKASEVVALSDTLMFAPSVRTILSRPLAESEQNVVQQIHDANEMSGLFQSMISGRQISGVRMYVRPSLIYSQENVNFFDYSDIVDTQWVHNMFAHQDKITWFSAEELGDGLGMVAACRPVRDYEQFDRYIGVLRVDIDEDTLDSIVAQAQSTPGAVALLVNSRGRLLTPSAMREAERDALISWALDSVAEDEASWRYEMIDGEKRLLGVTDIPNTDWTLLCAVPLSDILAPSRAMVAPLLVTTAICALITTALALLFSRNTGKRVGDLLDEMALLETGSFASPAPDEQWRDDIGILSYQFHRMREQLYSTLRERSDALDRLRQSELRALQAQINPHFLYNTLDFIRWDALNHGAQGLADTVLALSRFYRLSLSGGQDTVALSQEIEHVSTYLQIQNARFENEIALTVDVPEDMLPLTIPRITLQPLVENAVYHGILPAFAGGLIQIGEVRIAGHWVEEGFVVRVEDNGVGLEEDVRQRLFTQQEAVARTDGGYGLGNIAERLAILGGPQSKIEVESQSGKGTAIVIFLPTDRPPVV